MDLDNYKSPYFYLAYNLPARTDASPISRSYLQNTKFNTKIQNKVSTFITQIFHLSFSYFSILNIKLFSSVYSLQTCALSILYEMAMCSSMFHDKTPALA